MSNVWLQSRFGKAIDMVDPRVEDVDFWEICLTLAHVNRWTGSADPDVSVAFHTMIVMDQVDGERLKTLALLHDFHEYNVGDLTVPSAMGIGEVMARRYGEPAFAWMLADSIKEYKLRHDRVIYAAAGVDMPDDSERTIIKRADVMAAMTERRDFLAPPPKLWMDEYEAVGASKTVYTSSHFGQTKDRVAFNLMQACRKYLPAVRDVKGQGVRAALGYAA